MSTNIPSGVNDVRPIRERSERKRNALELFRGLPRHYDRLSAALSLGQDPRWRRALVGALAVPAGARVLDVATGTGMVIAELLRAGAGSVVGLDQSGEMLSVARARFAPVLSSGGGADGGAAQAQSSSRVELIDGQAEALPFADGSFDALTFTYLLRYVDDPAATLAELARVVRPGGRMASLEFGVPPQPLARLAWRLYTVALLPALGRLISHEWGAVGRFLGPSIRDFYALHPLPRIVDYWQAAGLEEVVVRRLSLGGAVIISARKAQGGGGAAR
jgi:demethylmenaquinone methyltransferase / 2-methoxy-6-polyprenyl-1,4-benzoquinol methylase